MTMDMNNENLTKSLSKDDCIPLRDESTPDLFNNFTEKDINKIALTLCSYSFIRKRHKVIEMETVRQFIYDSLSKQPHLYEAFKKIKNTKPKVPKHENPLNIKA